MKEYDITITEVLEKTVQVQAESREEAEAIASENWNNSMYDMDSAEDYADVSFHAGEEREISPPELMDVLLVSPGEYPKAIRQVFHQPETFVRMGKSIMALPIPDKEVQRREAARKEQPEQKAGKVIRFPKEPAL